MAAKTTQEPKRGVSHLPVPASNKPDVHPSPENDQMESDDIQDPDSKEELESMMEMLSKTAVKAPHNTPRDLEFKSLESFPSSYKRNNRKEKKVLDYAENFRRQYTYLYKDRKPLLLFPKNECDIPKLVCTTIRPTLFPYPELFEWDGISQFVSDYLQAEMLYPAYELPNNLLSPATVLRRQRGTCFEYATILCSLLLAAGYDAYIVSGYATLHVCSANETLKTCPLLKTEKKPEPPKPEKVLNKYAVRPPKELASKHETKQKERAEKEKKENEAKLIAEEKARIVKLEEPPEDLMRGMRVHCWVLVLAGIREVPEDFFIEPFTGEAEPLITDCYQGIESVWNHQNYWVNMQDCSIGISKMRYDLTNSDDWEYLFPRDSQPSKRSLESNYNVDYDDDDDPEVANMEKYLDMPASWVEKLEISPTEFEMRYPNGKKVVLFKKAKVEKFADYKMPDGLVTRISVYSDYERKKLILVKEMFKHRSDKLYLRERNYETLWVREYFYNGRECSLKQHDYKFESVGPESERTMIFNHHARVDGLEKRIETNTSMTEHFIARKNLLYYKYVEFDTRPLVFAPQISGESEPRPITTIIEKFHRNPEKLANDDIAKVVFSQEKIFIQYHIGDEFLTYSTREFIKSNKWTDRNALSIDWAPDIHTCYQVGEPGEIKKDIDIYNCVRSMITAEFESKDETRKSEMEVKKILERRLREESLNELSVSVYDTLRNDKAALRKNTLQALEDQAALKKTATFNVDYLAPFLARIGHPDTMTREQAIGVKEACLSDLKKRIEDKANLIQMRFEKETKELVKRQELYQKNQVTMQKTEEDEYLKYCEEAIFRIHVLEVRLNRYKEMAPMWYMNLEKKLKADNRLKIIYRKSTDQPKGRFDR
ncbi:dynein regulatory complex subunit 7-like [Argonauta hians]